MSDEGRPSPLPGLLVTGAAEVVTMRGGLRRGPAQDEPAVLRAPSTDPGDPRAPALAAWEGRIVAVGPGDEVRRAIQAGGYPADRFAVVDAHGGTVTPGLIDPHTHLLFAGTREGEMRLRQRGASYLEILGAGGGILSTVAATRAASGDELAAHGRRWLGEMLAHGVTTVEAKSGYGLDATTELRLLEVAERLGREGPIEVVPTFLGLHAVPPELRDRPDGADAYATAVATEMIPAVLEQGFARSCRPAPRWGWRRGCTPTSWPRRAGPSWRPRWAPSRPTTWRCRRPPASTPSRARPSGRARSSRHCSRRRRSS